MQIRKLKLSGFKSFVEPAELRIEPGLTGVVGPNGCGKSNLLEAIRWVMGENSPKSMRGSGMEDVIFAGTAQRPPRNFAEVVLAGKDDQHDELEVVRRIERGAGSAYRINGRDVRAKDVSLLFADAATGAHSPALVSQGKIAAVIAAKPAERRQMLEEAAGIAGLHVRRRDAESKLRQTEANLARLDDLMAGLNTQISSLRRQARQAERYKALSDQIQVAEARLLFARWRDAAAAADAARKEAEAASERVTAAQTETDEAQKAQHLAAGTLTQARDEMADRRDDASAHGHRMAALTSQLEAAEQRLADLDRQKQRLEEDRGEADRMTRDAAEALQKLERELAGSEKALADDEARRPALARAAEQAESASRAAELAFAKATADHAGVEAEWRVAEAALEQANTRLQRLEADAERHAQAEQALRESGDAQAAVTAARIALDEATAALTTARATLASMQERKTALSSTRDEASAALATAKAELTGVEREFSALERDREARKRQAANKHGLPAALDKVRAAPGYERALAAVLGRDAKAPLGKPDAQVDGRFWTGGPAPLPVADSLAAHVPDCPDELTARLALVHLVDADDGRTLAPGEWLVTKDGLLRRWDGFVARGEGAAEAARLEADNRHAELASQLPALQLQAEQAAAEHTAAQSELSTIQTSLIAAERELAALADKERAALRAFDQAEDAKARQAARAEELAAARKDLAERRQQAVAERDAAAAKRDTLPDPESGRAGVDASQAWHESARTLLQTATAELAAHDQ
ncbi:MAG: chromosome segregation SMC family protein, partial [Novosphingobium sp.]